MTVDGMQFVNKFNGLQAMWNIDDQRCSQSVQQNVYRKEERYK